MGNPTKCVSPQAIPWKCGHRPRGRHGLLDSPPVMAFRAITSRHGEEARLGRFGTLFMHREAGYTRGFGRLPNRLKCTTGGIHGDVRPNKRRLAGRWLVQCGWRPVFNRNSEYCGSTSPWPSLVGRSKKPIMESGLRAAKLARKNDSASKRSENWFRSEGVRCGQEAPYP
jgi:hypothetical protein